MKITMTCKNSEEETDIADTSLNPKKSNLIAKLQYKSNENLIRSNKT